jgi:hypothetical protein
MGLEKLTRPICRYRPPEFHASCLVQDTLVLESHCWHLPDHIVILGKLLKGGWDKHAVELHCNIGVDLSLNLRCFVSFSLPTF